MSIRLPFTFYRRIPTKEIHIGSLTLGGNAPIRIQTMTNTDTNDIHATVEQIKRIYEAGSELVRLAVPGFKEVESIKEIAKKLNNEHIPIPLIADVHFNPQVAEAVAPFVQKVRINPGNYVNRSKSSKPKNYTETDIAAEKEEISKRFIPLLRRCSYYGTAIRIGINYASLSWRIIHQYGNTPEAMVASALEFLELCKNESFKNIVLSLKASDIRQTIYANRLFVKEMLLQQPYAYPIHIGITEAGLDLDGRIKSLIGIGTLLHDGIGDTIRVSLTENPEKEILVAKNIIHILHQNINEKPTSFLLHHCPFENNRRQTITYNSIGNQQPVDFIVTSPHHPLPKSWNQLCSSPQINVVKIDESDSYYKVREKIHPNLNTHLPLLIWVKTSEKYLPEKLYIILGSLLSEGFIDALILETTDEHVEQWNEALKIILQVTGSRRVYNEYISCPSCGRTQFDIEKVSRLVKEKTKHLSGYKIAVMGCVVNGPGEMHDADYGLVGAGNNKVNLYSKGKLLYSGLSLDLAIEQLLKMIEADENLRFSNRKDT